MGFWLVVGKTALKVGVPFVADFARTRLLKKGSKAHREEDRLDAEAWQGRERARRRREDRQRAKAAR